MKVPVGARKNLLCPMPVVMVGANVNGKANYTTVAYVGIISRNFVSVAMAKPHYSNAGIKENGTFSVNIPSEDQVKETDYCGIVSGNQVDKSKVFTTFYGRLKTAPMIEECPVNLECKLTQTIDTGRGETFIGEIEEAYVNADCMNNDMVDYDKVKPILFVTEEATYWKLGPRFADAWKVGEELKRT